VFRNFGKQNSNAGESPKGNNTTFRTRPKLEIKNNSPTMFSMSSKNFQLHQDGHVSVPEANVVTFWVLMRT